MSAPAATSFSFEPIFLVLAAAAVYGYVRLAKTVERPGPARAMLFGLGSLLVAVSLNSPLETIAVHYLLVVHLLQNVMIADWAPPLLVLGLTPAMRAVVAARGGRALAFLTRPRVALPLWLAVWYGVHLPVFYDFALRHPLLLNAEHGALIFAGLVFWWPVFSNEPHRLSSAVRLVYLGAAYAGSAFLSLALIFSARAFYGFYEAAPRLWGLSPQKDQNLGGILMNAEQLAVFFVAMSYFLLRLLSEEEESQRAIEGR
ncbi:MAG: cytochrome c oxidase assembly protein [Actinomycetota bacterium]|nr:cytochrome c oxidase assembly protein [Actinomycetota bacterium]